MAGGRPSTYTEAIALELCERIANGESLRSICAEDGMPAQRTVFKWLSAHPEFVQQYSHAREAQADTLFDEILDIADDGSNDWMLRKRGDLEAWVENGEALRRSQLRVDARKWMAGKLRPKKYGEKVTQEISGPDGRPIEIEAMSDRDRARAMLMLAQKAKDEPQRAH